MNNNSKNLLQEFCQKNRKKLPVYSTLQSVENSSKNVSFTSSVKLWDGMVFTGDPQPSKKKSESDAAFRAYESLIKTLKRKVVVSKDSTLLLVNFESINCIDLIKNYNFCPFLTPLFYISKNHPYSSQRDGRFIVVDSLVEKAVDLGIITTTIDLLSRNYTIYNKVIILSSGSLIKAFSDIYIQKLIVNSNSTRNNIT